MSSPGRMLVLSAVLVMLTSGRRMVTVVVPVAAPTLRLTVTAPKLVVLLARTVNLILPAPAPLALVAI